MSNNHLLSDIQCLITFKILRLSKVAGLFCSSAQGWAMSDSLWSRAGAQLFSMSSSSQERAGLYIRLECALSCLYPVIKQTDGKVVAALPRVQKSPGNEAE